MNKRHPMSLMIEDKFLELMQTTDLENIHVTQITRGLAISRQTFYLHFNSIDDLVLQTETRVLDEMGRLFKSFANIPLDDRYFYVANPQILNTIRYLKKRRKLFLAMLSKHGDLNFQNQFNDLIKRNIFNSGLRSGYIKVPSGMENAACEYLIGGCNRLTRLLITSEKDYSENQLAIAWYRLTYGAFRIDSPV